MVAAKLRVATEETASLKEDIRDVTESHNAKLAQLHEAFAQEKKDETAKLIQQYEEQMKTFESKIRSEIADENSHTSKKTRLMICLQECVRKMLRERLEKREQELQLELVTVKENMDDFCSKLKAKEEEFEKFKEENA